MKYPQIKDNDFYKRINTIYKKFTIPKQKKSLKEICFPSHFELQLPQKFLAEFINPKTPYKGILIYHQIGSGKTCTAIRIAEEWKNKRKILILLPASLKGNFRSELRSSCAGNNYLKPEERERLKVLHPTDEEYIEIIDRSDERINKYYTIYSYNKFTTLAQEKKIDLKNTLLIIDEVQNTVSEEGTFYHVLYNQIMKAPYDLRIVLLSATPMFDKPSELALTLNLLRLPHPLPVGTKFEHEFIKITKTHDGKYTFDMKNQDKFKEAIKGYVSFFKGAPPYVFPEMTIKYVRCEMSEFQYSAYKTVLKNEEKDFKKNITGDLGIGNLPNNFFIGTRMISNVVFPNRKINEEGFKSFRGKYITENLHKYSTKFDRIMRKIENGSGKMFVYSNFKEYGGVKSFARVLDEFGFKNYVENGEGRRRYAVWSGDEKPELKEEIKSVFNQKVNLDGSKLKLLLLTPSAQAGISLTGIRQAHILDPTWNWSKMMQIIGRGSRFCSHKDLEEEKRNIKVYIYQAVYPEENETVDQYISYLAKQKDKLIKQFERVIKDAAIDCTLNKYANVMGNADPINCVE